MDKKYYIIDYGKETIDIAQDVIQSLKDNKHHVLVCLTNLDKYFAVEEITQDAFLDFYDEMNPRYDN